MAASVADILLSRAPSLGERRAALCTAPGAARSLSWRELGETALQVARALIASGVAPGDRVGLVGWNTLEWIAADWGVLAAGAVSRAAHPGFSPGRIARLLSGVRAAFVADPGTLARLRAAGADLGGQRPLALLAGAAEGAETWGEFLARGAAVPEANARARTAAVRAEDPAAEVQTSGATGAPRTLVLSHGALLYQAGAVAQSLACSARDVFLHGVPLACPMARALHLAATALGASAAVTGAPEAEGADLPAASPTVLHLAGRLPERFYGAFLDRYEDAGPELQERFRAAVKAGRRMSECLQRGEPIPYDVGKEMERAQREVLGEFRAALGGALRFLIPSRAVLPPEIAEFYHACGALTLGGYGLAEAGGFAALSRFDRFKFGAAGAAPEGAELRASVEGEILARAPSLASGLALEDGRVRTGDAGHVDPGGHLHFFGRRSELFALAGGERAAAASLEKMLRGDPFIARAVVLGPGRPYLTALVEVDEAEVLRAAREAGARDASPSELLRSEDLRLSIEETIREVNAHLREPMHIRDYRLLPRPLSADLEELTPYGEPRRAEIQSRWHDLVEDMYR